MIDRRELLSASAALCASAAAGSMKRHRATAGSRAVPREPSTSRKSGTRQTTLTGPKISSRPIAPWRARQQTSRKSSTKCKG